MGVDALVLKLAHLAIPCTYDTMANPSIGATAIVAPEAPMDVAAQTSVLNKLLVASFSVIRLYI